MTAEIPLPNGMILVDRTGAAITSMKWVTLRFEDPDYHRIGLEEWEGREVSTVWVGIVMTTTAKLHHRPGYGAFETLIQGGPNHGQMIKYATEEEACVGHILACLREHME